MLFKQALELVRYGSGVLESTRCAAITSLYAVKTNDKGLQDGVAKISIVVESSSLKKECHLMHSLS